MQHPVYVTTDDLITDTIPTRLGYMPNNAVAIAVMNRDTIATGLMLIDLLDVATADERHATVERVIQIMRDLDGRSVVLATYTTADPTPYRPIIDAMTAALNEHVTVTAYYLHGDRILDDDLQQSRPAPLHPIIAARTRTATSEDDLTAATLATNATTPAAALDHYLALVDAALNGTYPEHATPATIGAALALMQTLTGRDAALIALFEPDTARNLIANPDTPLANALAHILGDTSTPTPDERLRAWAIVLWDLHAHATDRVHAALTLTVLAALALASANMAVARTVAAEAVREVGATHRAARLAMLVMHAADADMRPGWAR